MPEQDGFIIALAAGPRAADDLSDFSIQIFRRHLAFVDMPARGYGTRSSTLLITERSDAGSVTHALERTYAADRSAPPRLRRTTLDAWPPAAGSRRAVAQSLKPVEVVDA